MPNTASGTGNYDAWVIKTNYLGDTLWTRTYGSPTETDCAAYVIPLTTLQEYFFEGKPIIYLLPACVEIDSDTYPYAAHLDESGNILWERIYSPENALFNGDVGEGLTFQTYPLVRADRSFWGIMFGYNSLGNPSNFLIDFDKYGIVNWKKELVLNPDADCYLKDMQPTPDGGYVLAGYQYTSPQKGWVLKIDSLGNTCSYIGCDSTVVVEVVPGIPDNLNTEIAAMVYPVPASTNLHIRYQIPAAVLPSGGAVWRLYDALGSQVAATTLPGNVGIEQISVAHLSAGIYYYRVVLPASGQMVASGKLVIN